ncbi:MAG: HYR domain-containing protein, partial [Bacteroidota bacterium]
MRFLFRSIFLVLCTYLCSLSYAQVTLVGWNMNSASSSSGITDNNGTTISAPGTGGAFFSGVGCPGGQEAIANNWSPGDSWATSGFSTKGYDNITVSYEQARFEFGPDGNWQLQYSTNNSTWVDVGSTYTTATRTGNSCATSTFTDVPLFGGASDQCELFVRLLNVDGNSGNGGGTVIDNLIVEGTTTTFGSCNLAINSAPATAANCGQNNGSITISASCSSCSVGLQYSINNGASFQASNSFTALAPGNYNVVVREGNSDCCRVEFGSNPVVVDDIPDTEPPTLTCQDASFDLDASGNFTLSVSTIRSNIFVTESDNCGIDPLFVGLPQSSFLSCSDLGENEITFFIRDDSGNPANCTVTVTVNDPTDNCNQPPVPVCRNLTVDADANCQGMANPQDFDNGSTDPNNDDLTFSLDQNGPFDLGTTNLVLTVSDGQESTTCNVSIIVEDNTPPTISNCQPIAPVVFADSDCDFDERPGTFFVQENCPAGLQIIERYFNEAGTNYLTLIFNEFPGPRILGTGRNLPLGQNTVELTLLDAAGNTNSCSFNITVVDNTPPVPPAAPAPLTFQCLDDVTPPITLEAEDNCDGFVTGIADDTDNGGSGCTNNPLIITRTWTFEDAAGNMSDVSQTITVVDDTRPVINTPSGSLDVTIDITEPDVCPQGDLSGTFCYFLSNADPAVRISTDWVIDGFNFGNFAGPALADISDNCNIANVTCSFANQTSTSCEVVWAVSWTAIDECGNASDPFVQTFTIRDRVAPVPPATPAPLTFQCVEDVPDPITLTAEDACQGTINGVLAEANNGGSGCPGDPLEIMRTWVFLDGCGNMSNVTRMITVVDDTDPVINTAPGSLDVEIDITEVGACPNGDYSGSVVNSGEPGVQEPSVTIVIDGVDFGDFPGPVLADVSDNCSVLAVVGAFFNENFDDCTTTLSVSWVAIDECSNESVPFEQTFTIRDRVAPEFQDFCIFDPTFLTSESNVCPADATISLTEGDVISVFDTWTVGGNTIPSLEGCITDNCQDEANFLINVDDITITGDGCERTITVTFIPDDGCGNLGAAFSCSYTFIDDTPPMVNFQGLPSGSTITRECNLNDPDWFPFVMTDELDIADDCNDFTIDLEDVLVAEGECGVSDFLSLWRCTWTVTDACDNVTEYTLFTRIVDTQGPDFTFVPEDLTIECDEEVPFMMAEATDDCGEFVITHEDVIIPGSCPQSFTIRRTFTATDGCGNPSTAVQLITVEDTTAPVISFDDEYISEYTDGQSLFVECSEYLNISKLRFATSAMDNCAGARDVDFTFEDFGYFDCLQDGYSGHLRTSWTSVDECGNSRTATLDWFLVDNEAPVLQGVPADACVSSLPPVPNVQAVDNCDAGILGYEQSEPMDCPEGGQFVIRTWTASDVCGNTTSASQRITLTNPDGPSVSIDFPGLAGLASGSTAQIPGDCSTELPDLSSSINVDSGCTGAEASIETDLLDTGDCATTGY